MVILALMVVRFILRVIAAHFYLALPDLLRRMCLPRSIISLRRDGQLQRNVVRPPGTGAAGGEINLRKLRLRPCRDRPCIDPKGLLG
jgi:hypothetical protein